MDTAQLLFLPGLVANERLFAPQMAQYPRTSTPKYTSPKPTDTLETYSRRFARSLAPKQPTVAIGFSFGGMILHQAIHQLPESIKAIITISTCESKKDITPKFKAQSKLLKFLPSPMLRTGLVAASSKFSPADNLTPQQRQDLKHMAVTTDLNFFRWATKACANWDFDGLPDFPPIPITRIHGENDTIIPISANKPDTIIPQGGHLLTLTHPQDIHTQIDHIAQKLYLNLY